MNQKERREFEVRMLVTAIENFVEAVITAKRDDHCAENELYLEHMRKDLIEALLEQLS